MSNSVNLLLNSLLPGVNEIQQKKKINSTTQLINENLKQRTKVSLEDGQKIKKLAKKRAKKLVKKAKKSQEELEQLAKKDLLKKHQKEGNLTENEQIYLQKIVKRNVRNLASYEVEDKDELLALQKQILSSDNKKNVKKQTRVIKKKALRAPGLTPGLAPVGASDEESSEEEPDFDDDY